MVRCLCPSYADAVTAVMTQGFDVAKQALLEFLDTFKTTVDPADREVGYLVSQ